MTEHDPGTPPAWHDDDDRAARLRVPPHSLEAEQSVLGGLMLDSQAWEQVGSVVNEADFYRYEHRVIFSAIRQMCDASQPLDLVTVHEWLARAGQAEAVGGMAYLNAMAASVPGAQLVRKYAEIVRERSMLRRLIAAADEIAVSAFNAGGRSARSIVEGATERIADVCREHYRQAPGGRIPLMGLSALRETAQAVRWLVKHVVPAESIGMLFGGSGTFKSFIMLDCALHVAHGMPWLGRRTAQGAVLYIAAEGGAGLWSRIDAWHRSRRMQWDDAPFYVVPAALDLKADAWRVVDAAQAVGVSPTLVIIDTLSQTYAGEENSAGEMAAYMRELGARFRQLWGCAVMLVHHTGHQATERPRGSSAIRANLDFLLGAFRDEKEMLATLSCVKQKDGELFQDAVFQMSVVELGRDDDGELVTSLVARHLSTPEGVEQARASEQAAGRGGRTSALLALAQDLNGQPERELRRAFYDRLEGVDPEAKRKAYFRAKQSAIDAGHIEVVEGIVVVSRGFGAQQ